MLRSGLLGFADAPTPHPEAPVWATLLMILLGLGLIALVVAALALRRFGSRMNDADNGRPASRLDPWREAGRRMAVPTEPPYSTDAREERP